MTDADVAVLRAAIRDVPAIDWTKSDDLTRFTRAVIDNLPADTRIITPSDSRPDLQSLLSAALHEARDSNRWIRYAADLDATAILATPSGQALADRFDADTERLRLARWALVRTGYFKEHEVGEDVAPRITELWSARFDAPSERERMAEAVFHSQMPAPNWTWDNIDSLDPTFKPECRRRADVMLAFLAQPAPATEVESAEELGFTESPEDKWADGPYGDTR